MPDAPESEEGPSNTGTDGVDELPEPKCLAVSGPAAIQGPGTDRESAATVREGVEGSKCGTGDAEPDGAEGEEGNESIIETSGLANRTRLIPHLTQIFLR